MELMVHLPDSFPMCITAKPLKRTSIAAHLHSQKNKKVSVATQRHRRYTLIHVLTFELFSVSLRRGLAVIMTPAAEKRLGLSRPRRSLRVLLKQMRESRRGTRGKRGKERLTDERLVRRLIALKQSGGAGQERRYAGRNRELRPVVIVHVWNLWFVTASYL